mgnify:CR=1 FL=1
MWDVILSFLAGIALGRILRPKKKVERSLPYIAYALIFLIGVEIGNQGILLQLPRILLSSFIIAVSAIICSIIAVKLLR